MVELKLDAAQTQALIRGALGEAARIGLEVQSVQPGAARVRIPYAAHMLRPGNVISGPTLFAAADSAMYALVLSHLGPELMAVTSQINMHFLNKATRGDVIADARLLKLGRSLIVMEALLRTGDNPTVVAQASGTYVRP